MKSSKKSLGAIGSIIFLVAVVGGFFWLWKTSEPSIENSTIDTAYQTIEIDSVKKEAETLIKDRENLSGIPIDAPAADQIGKDNPFVK